MSDLLTAVEQGKIQLPEFQRNWAWDDFGFLAFLDRFWGYAHSGMASKIGSHGAADETC